MATQDSVRLSVGDTPLGRRLGFVVARIPGKKQMAIKAR